jgi:DNA adenine methylase
MSKPKFIPSPLRYPGGKSREATHLSNFVPEGVKEYREPFVGGGSVWIKLKQLYPDLSIWINDLNPEVSLFWEQARDNLTELVNQVTYLYQTSKPDKGKGLYSELTSVNPQDLSSLDRATRFFVLNRITFSGTTESGGYSNQAFDKRFTLTSLDRLAQLEAVMSGVKVTNYDYSVLLTQSSTQPTILYLDPPYSNSKGLYGKSGSLHDKFDHIRLKYYLTLTPMPWFMTYDDSTAIRELWGEYDLLERTLSYSMNSTKGKELIIRSPNLALTPPPNQT